MKKLFTSLIALAAVAGYSAAEIPAGLPSTLPDNAIGYELISSVDEIIDGDYYVIRAVFPTSSNIPDAFVQATTATVDDAEVSINKLVSTSSVTDASTIIWQARPSTDSERVWTFYNDGNYMSWAHGANITSNVICGGTSGTIYNLVSGIYTTTVNTNAANMMTLINGTTTERANDGITTVFQLRAYSQSATRIMGFYNQSTTGYEIGAGASSSDFGGSSTISDQAYTTTSFFAVYHVQDATDAAKETYKNYISAVQSIDADAYNTAIAAIDNAKFGSELRSAALTALSGHALTLSNKNNSAQYLGINTNGLTATTLATTSYWLPTFGVDYSGGMNITLYSILGGVNAGVASTSPSNGSQVGTDATGVPFTFESKNGYWLFKNVAHYLNTNTTIANTVYWDGGGDGDGSGDGSQWLPALADDAAKAALKADLEGSSATAGEKTVGTGLNEYTDQSPDARAAFNEVYNDSESTFSDILTAYQTAKPLITSDALVINQPLSGRYIRIHTAPTWCTSNSSWAGTPYLSSTNYNDTHTSFVTTKDASTIMYYTGERLIAYATGRYATGSGTYSMIYFTTDAEGAAANTGVSIEFSEGYNESGTYHMKYNNIRYMYTNASLYTDGGTGNTASGYNFQLEYVDELPLTIGSDGAATFCAPVAVTIPSGTDCKFFTATLSGTDLTITPVNAGTECAAHTPIFVQGAADTTVNFPINYDAPEAESDENTVATFYANTAWSSFSEQEGYLTYMPTTATATETETDSSASAAPAIRRAASETTDATVAFAKLAAGGDITANVPILNVPTSSIGNSEPVETFTIDLSVTVPDTFSLVSVVTSINEVNADAAAQQPIYDLQGRRVTSTPTHGIFIFGNKIRRI
jgi:hypothetical protein